LEALRPRGDLVPAAFAAEVFGEVLAAGALFFAVMRFLEWCRAARSVVGG